MSVWKIVSWNICHGGSVKRRRKIIDVLLAFEADMLVVPEFRANANGDVIIKALREAGYYTTCPPAPQNENTVLLASCMRMHQARSLSNGLPDYWRLWVAELPSLKLCGVYIPGNKGKFPYWNAIIQAMAQDSGILFAGDFNTGSNTLDKDPQGVPFIGAEYLDRVAEQGFVDLWRSRHLTMREYSWYSNNRGLRNGFRLDHAFGSPDIDRCVIACNYLHEPRLSGASDHSALVLELRMPEGAPIDGGS